MSSPSLFLRFPNSLRFSAAAVMTYFSRYMSQSTSAESVSEEPSKVDGKVILTSTSKGAHTLHVYQMPKIDYVDCHYKWALAQNWTPTKDSAEATFALDPKGFYGLRVDGTKAGTISAIKYPLFNTTFVGFFIIDEPHRGIGYGSHLWSEVMREIKLNGYNISLDCLDHTRAMYENMGFMKVGSDRVLKFQSDTKTPETCKAPLFPIDAKNLSAVLQFDRQVFQSSARENFLSAWIQKKDTISIAYFDEENQVAGYGVMSRRLTNDGEVGYRIGPLYANNDDIASCLITYLKSHANGEVVFMDTSNNHRTSTPLAEALGFKPVVDLHRMATDGKEFKPDDRVYGLTSLAYSPQ